MPEPALPAFTRTPDGVMAKTPLIGLPNVCFWWRLGSRLAGFHTLTVHRPHQGRRFLTSGRRSDVGWRSFWHAGGNIGFEPDASGSFDRCLGWARLARFGGDDLFGYHSLFSRVRGQEIRLGDL